MYQADLFKDKVIIVTGGGSGIGYEISKQFLQLGAKVWITSRKEERLQKAQAELQAFGNCHYSIVDIRKNETLDELADKIKTEDGKLDILINNAGGQFFSPAEYISQKGWDAVINNNLNGSWYATYTMAKKLFIPQKNGIVVNIIANMFRGFPGMVHTGAARAGVDNFTKTLAVEWAKYKIRINAIAPGVIYTSGLDTYPDAVKKMTLEEVPKTIPMKRLGTAEDIAYMTLFLSSPMADYITGETIYVDGGHRLHGSMWEI